MSQIRIRSSLTHDTPAGADAPWFAIAGHGARLLAGLLLLTAAGLKAYQAIHLDPPPAGVEVMTIVAAETILGLWLLSTLARRLAHLVALGCFVVFAFVNAVMGHLGQASCGCYGPVELNPWVSLMINLGVILVLGLTLPRTGPWLRPWTRRPAVGLAAAGVVILAVLLPVMVLMAEDRREAYDPANPAQTVVYVEPQRWLGQPLPILPAIADGQRLQHGRWKILFYKHDCPACRSELRDALASDAPPRHTRRMVIEVPPFGPADRAGEIRRAGWRYARLSDERTWFFPTPTTIRVEEGRVVQVDDAVYDADAPPVVETGRGLVELDPAALSPPPPHDLGYVPAGGVREFALAVTNPLDRDLAIRRVEVECICTKVLETPATIPAGATVQVPVRFEALEQPQPYAKGVALHTTDAALPVIQLTVQARIGLPLTVEPEAVDADMLVADGEVTLTIRNDAEQPLRLLYSSAELRRGSTTDLIAAVPRQAIVHGETARVPVRLIAEAVEPADLHGYLQIHTNSREQPLLSVPIR